MIDSQGREIDYVRISITDRCNFRCRYCMPEKGIEKRGHDEIMRFSEVINLIKTLTKLGIKKVRFTGGEPLVVRNITELIGETSKIEGVEEIAITTNGSLLEDMAEELYNAGLNRVNISLDTLNEDKFSYITRRGDLKKVLRGIDKCLQIGLLTVKINAVLVKGFNDNEVEDLINLTINKPISVRFIEMMPIGEAVQFSKKGIITSDEILKNFPELIPFSSEKSGTAKLYKFKNSIGTVGFISPMSCKFCENCNRIRVTSMGTLKLCLHSEEEVNLKPYLNNEDKLYSILREAIFNKPKEHHLVEEKNTRSLKVMNQIGG